MNQPSQTDEPLLRVADLEKHFESARLSGKRGRPIKAVDGVSLTINAGQTLGLVGESGSGKSTVGRLIVRLLQPTGGRIFIDGEEITDPDCDMNFIRSQIGMVFQQFNLFPHLNVEENVTIAQRTVLKRSKRDAVDVGRNHAAQV